MSKSKPVALEQQLETNSRDGLVVVGGNINTTQHLSSNDGMVAGVDNVCTQVDENHHLHNPSFETMPFWKDFVAGNVGGMCGILAGHPFDTLKGLFYMNWFRNCFGFFAM